VTREQKCLHRENKNATRARKKNTFTENECLPNFELKFNILEHLRKPLTLKSTRKRIDFERVFIVCALARLANMENVCFCSEKNDI